MNTNTDTDVKTFAAWMGAESQSTFLWPQGCVDNRLSRVRGRIARYGMEAPIDGTLRLFATRDEANAYIDQIRKDAGV